MFSQIIPPPAKRHGVYSFVGTEACFEWQQGESRYSTPIETCGSKEEAIAKVFLLNSILGGSTIKYEFI
jgi:hypothetical protein